MIFIGQTFQVIFRGFNNQYKTDSLYYQTVISNSYAYSFNKVFCGDGCAVPQRGFFINHQNLFYCLE